MIKLSEIRGQVYDVSYTPMAWCYDNVVEFVNHVCDIEIEIAMADFPNNYKDDEIYQNCKKIKDSQAISEDELNCLLSSYYYEIV